MPMMQLSQAAEIRACGVLAEAPVIRRRRDSRAVEIYRKRAMRITSLRSLLLGVTILLAGTSAALAGGFEIPNQGARGAGQAEAFAAQADDASAIYYNPAGLTQLHGTSFTGGLYGLFPDFTFQGDQGQHEDMRLPSVLPSFYAESDFGLEKFRFGIGVNNAMGLNLDWGSSGPLADIVDKAHLIVIGISPTVAYQVTDNLSLGMAFNIYYGDIFVRHNVPLGPPPTPIGSLNLHGNDWGFGFTPGLMWKLDDRNTFAAFYRSGYTLDFDGDARITAPGIPTIGSSHAHAPINFPQIIGGGYAFRPIKPLKLEADVVWTDWTTLHKIEVYSNNPVFNGTQIPEDWRSGFSYRFGVQYDLNPQWALRGGYAYGQEASPGNTFSPLVPDANYHLFTVGVGYTQPHWGFDVAYQFALRENRHISTDDVNGPSVAGTYGNTINCVFLSVTYKL